MSRPLIMGIVNVTPDSFSGDGLLAPVGADNLSQYISQQEYSRLFEGDHMGVSSSTEYRSGGDWFEKASQYGNSGNFGYAFDAEYRLQNGDRPNNDLEQTAYDIKANAYQRCIASVEQNLRKENR